jgi:flagellar basal-body rod protein FlgG
MEAQQTKMDVIAHNLANASTTGFKKERADFEDLLSETLRGPSAPDPRGGTEPAPLQGGLGVRAASTSRSFAQGDMIQSQNPLDLAIQGDGFFRVQRQDGTTGFTRAGNLRIDATGRLATQNGELIDPPIQVPPETTQLTIAADGTITAKVAGRDDLQTLGQLELATFQNPQGLLSLGNNLFQATPASGQETRARSGQNGAGTIAQGYLEGANVKAVEEMIEMISTQRAYELNSKVIQSADQMLQRLTSLR